MFVLHLGLMVNPIAENNKNWSDLAFSTALIFSLSCGAFEQVQIAGALSCTAREA